jgi:hypothetical protein
MSPRVLIYPTNFSSQTESHVARRNVFERRALSLKVAMRINNTTQPLIYTVGKAPGA